MNDHTYAGGPGDLVDEIGSQFGQNDVGDRCVDDDTVGDKNSSQSSKDSLLEVDADPSPHKEELYERHKTLLLTRSREKFTVLRFCPSDDDIRYYTGFTTYSCYLGLFSVPSTRV